MSGEIFYKIKLYLWLYIVYSKYWEILKFWYNDYLVLFFIFFFDVIEIVSGMLLLEMRFVCFVNYLILII